MAGPTYTYTSTVPQGSTPFNQTQAPILNNFQAIAELIAVNHVAFNTPNDFGKHNFISMPNQSDLPGTTSTEIAMFTQVTGSPNPCEIFIQYPENGTTAGATLQISDDDSGSTGSGTSTGTTYGSCSFPSGVIFRWGTFSAVTGTTAYINLTTSGAQYTYNQYPGCLAPTTSGVPTQNNAAIYNGSGNGGNFSQIPANGPTATYNYFMMGQ